MAVNDPTTRFSWNLPNVSGDPGTWGTLLNAILGDDVTGIDEILYDVQTTANAALPKAGGAMTGHLDLKTSHATGAQITGGSGTKAIDISAANYYRFTTGLSGSVTLNITNGSSSSPDFEAVIIQIKNPGVASGIAFQYGGSARTVQWQDGAAPTWTTVGDDVIVLFTYNGWATIIGVVAVQDPS